MSSTPEAENPAETPVDQQQTTSSEQQGDAEVEEVIEDAENQEPQESPAQSSEDQKPTEPSAQPSEENLQTTSEPPEHTDQPQPETEGASPSEDQEATESPEQRARKLTEDTLNYSATFITRGDSPETEEAQTRPKKKKKKRVVRRTQPVTPSSTTNVRQRTRSPCLFKPAALQSDNLGTLEPFNATSTGERTRSFGATTKSTTLKSTGTIDPDELYQRRALVAQRGQTLNQDIILLEARLGRLLEEEKAAKSSEQAYRKRTEAAQKRKDLVRAEQEKKKEAMQSRQMEANSNAQRRLAEKHSQQDEMKVYLFLFLFRFNPFFLIPFHLIPSLAAATGSD